MSIFFFLQTVFFSVKNTFMPFKRNLKQALIERSVKEPKKIVYNFF